MLKTFFCQEREKVILILVPNDIDNIHRFHMSCYSKLTALSKTGRENHMTSTLINMTNLTE